MNLTRFGGFSISRFTMIQDSNIRSLLVKVQEQGLLITINIWEEPDTLEVDTFISYGENSKYPAVKFMQDHPNVRSLAKMKAREIWKRGFIKVTLICDNWQDFLDK